MSWLGPDTCGVKLDQFDRMTQDMSRAAPRLEELAHHLWQALHGAGVSTEPAMDIKRLASWAATASADLRRRNLLAHNLDRQGLAMRVSRPDGIYLKLPDRYSDQIAYGDGRRTADLVRRAAAGDQKAMAELRRIVAGDVKPAFAKGLLEALGPDGLLKVPLDFIRRLKADITRLHNVDAMAWDTRTVLALLGRSLAVTSHPSRNGYIGDDYLKRLTQAGRASFPPLVKPPDGVVGYQSLSAILAAGGNRFSAEFLRTVGGDMIAYDREIHRKPWGAPLPDLTGKLALGNALDPGTNHVTAGERKTDFLIPLLNAAAASGRQGAQALLSPRPMGPHTGDPSTTFPKNTNLEHLLHSRRIAWAQTDHGAALGGLITTATKGHDPESERLALHTIDLLAREARGYFSVDPKELKLQAGDKERVDALSGLRPHLAGVLSTHIVKVNDLYRTFAHGANPTNAPVTDVDLDYVLLDLSRDSNAFSTVLNAQIAHAKVAIYRAAASGNRERLKGAIADNGRIFGHLLEARNQTIIAEGGRVDAANKQLQGMVSFGAGLVSTAGAEVAARRGGAMGEMAYDQTAQRAVDLLAAQLVKSLEQKPDQSLAKPTTDAEAVEALFGQMIVSSLVSQRNIGPKELDGKPFAEGDPPRLRPLDSLTPEQYSGLLRWVDRRFFIGGLQQQATDASSSGMDQVTGHYKTPDGQFNVGRSGQR